MEMNRVVVRYHEVALKKTNRTDFVAQLTRNMLRQLEGTGVSQTHRAPGRIILHLSDPTTWPAVRERLRHVFGIANFLLCERFDSALPELAEHIARVAETLEFQTFAVRTKRCNKAFPIGSQEVSALIGSAVQRRSGRAVDLLDPDLEIHVEILPRETLYSLEKVPGPGGLPSDSAGTVLALLSGGIDSPVAAHRLLRRGCRVEFVHFYAAGRGRASLEKAVELMTVLRRWQPTSRLHTVRFDDVQNEIVARAPRRARVVLYRRMMLRIAQALAASIDAEALVTGDSLGQVASQTLQNLVTIEEACGLPVLRPLIGLDKEEIVAQARQIGTYEISIQPDEDCCQIFAPKHPATRMTVGAARAAESALDVPSLIAGALSHLETIEDASGTG
jgi:thiamine biosynthesis protein ThiI